MSGLEELLNYKRIALYGLGTETERFLLENGDRYDIVGLLDGFREDGELYGQPIVSLSFILEKKVDLILVIARPGSCKAIAKRIGNFCKENSIALYDIRGVDLLSDKKVCFDFSSITGGTRAELLEKIKRADVVSFDLFDTLIMRQVLEPTDIYDLVNAYLEKRGIYIDNFQERRLASEKILSRDMAPTLEEIYLDVLKDDESILISATELAKIEWDIDFSTILPRYSVCKILNDLEKSKKVCIISDTYYTSGQLKRILHKCGIDRKVEIFASCECHTSKTQNLFKKFREKVIAQKYLHIGDDLVADVEATAKEGIDTFHLYSGRELFDAIGTLGTSAYTKSITDKVRCGMFVSRLFNNPFQFETDEKKIDISTAYDIGYLLCAPMITDFMLWFEKTVSKNNIENIWLSARDGYLLQELYKIFDPKKETTYFLTSRMAAIRAGMETLDDIAYVNSMKYSGSVIDSLKTRFGLDAEGLIGSKEEGCLMDFQKEILTKSVSSRENYNNYIKQLAIKNGDIAFFDFVAKGTTQMYVEKLVSNHFKGLYFIQLEPEFMGGKGLDIEAFYKKEEVNNSSIYENYYILETILTAPHPSVCEFNNKGEAIYAEETRTKESINCVLEIQEAIKDYFASFVKLTLSVERNENKALDEVFLGLIHSLQISDEGFKQLIVEDPFFNRNTNVVDLL